MGKLVHGIGFNDNKYQVFVDGKKTDEYNIWQNMLRRCKVEFWVVRPSYEGTTCSENFKSYSFFYEWYHKQYNATTRDVKDNKWCLDKDILVKGNKLYSEDTCVFVPHKINNLLVKANSVRGEYPIGVSLRGQSSRLMARCNRSDGTMQHLGYFSSAEDAFQVYKTYKEALIKKLANEYKHQLDPRAYQALLNYTVEITD